MYMEQKEIQVLEKKVMPLVAQAESQQITNAEDMQSATIVLSELGKYYDAVVAKREEITKPINLALKNARAMFEPIEKPAKLAYEGLRQKIAQYQTEQMKLAKAEEEKIASRIGEGKGKLKIETAMKKMDEIETPDAQVHTESGSLKFRKDKVLEITDPSLIPAEYWVIDEKSLLAHLKSGKQVPGAKLGEKLIPINTR